MTVKQLIDELECYNEDMEVVIRGGNSGGYVDSTDNVSTTEVTGFWGSNDYEAVLISGSQVGMGS